MATYVYIDGFNLYYGAVKHTKLRWLDIGRMCRLLLPGHDIVGFPYCTAIVSGRDNDPDKPLRQQMYLRALQTIPNLSISLGTFMTHVVPMRLANPPANGAKCVRVIKTEEKGSDVNLATHLLHDAHLDRYDVAVVVSNDSDLIEPMRIVRREMGKCVGVLNPQRHPCKAIVPEVDFFKQIRQGAIAASQFPDVMTDARGSFHKPAKWM